jgi:hypothetical protein
MAAYVTATAETPVGLESRRSAPIQIGSRTTIPRPKKAPRSVPVAGVARPIEVKIASEMAEWEQAYQLVAMNYRAYGYESPDAGPLRFTNYHVLPETTTFIAKHGLDLVATLSLVTDNYLLGLPLESIYPDEIDQLRQAGRRIVEVTNLADTGLSLREFVPVFVALMRVMTQYALRQNADTLVISVNPRHSAFYRKMMGFVPLGPWRAYPAVQNHPAEAYLLNVDLLRENAPRMYETILGEWLPADALWAPRMSLRLVHYFASRSLHTDEPTMRRILEHRETFGGLCRWTALEESII